MTVSRNHGEVKPNGKKRVNLRVMCDPPTSLPVMRTVAEIPYAAGLPGPAGTGSPGAGGPQLPWFDAVVTYVT